MSCEMDIKNRGWGMRRSTTVLLVACLGCALISSSALGANKAEQGKRNMRAEYDNLVGPKNARLYLLPGEKYLTRLKIVDEEADPVFATVYQDNYYLGEVCGELEEPLKLKYRIERAPTVDVWISDSLDPTYNSRLNCRPGIGTVGFVKATFSKRL